MKYVWKQEVPLPQQRLLLCIHVRGGHQRPTQAYRPQIFYYLILSNENQQSMPILVSGNATREPIPSPGQRRVVDTVSRGVHWGSSHEGSGRHPRQHGGACFRAAGRFALILRCLLLIFLVFLIASGRFETILLLWVLGATQVVIIYWNFAILFSPRDEGSSIL